MGLWISSLYSLFESFTKGEPARILMIGLDAAGKTTILYKVKQNENVQTTPTIGFNLEEVTPVKGISFTVWDIGGRNKIRQLRGHYFNDTDGLLFVVDSTDQIRAEEAKEELHEIFESEEMRGVPVVVMANKQDLPNAMCPSTLIDKLELRHLRSKWHIQGCCATNAEGVYESMEVLAGMVKEFKKNNRYR